MINENIDLKPIIISEELIYKYASYEDEDTKKDDNFTESITALNNINISIDRGDFVAILGHNGSGKSTFAKHMNALLQPTSGTIWVNSIDTKNDENIWEIRHYASMVFQNPDNQIVATIVEDDVAFGPENLGIPSKEIRKRVNEALENVGMLEYAEQSPHFLSGGQKQRVAIAGILAMKPLCIILDEPTAMLDPKGRKEVMDTIIRLNREEGITIILITHYMEEAVLANRVIVMEQGSVVMDGTPKDIFSKVDEIKSFGLDVPQVTECCYLLKKSGINIPDGILSIKEMLEAINKL